jgi:hypothetical protein
VPSFSLGQQFPGKQIPPSGGTAGFANSLKRNIARSPTCEVAMQRQPAKYQTTHFIRCVSAPPMPG